MKTRKKTPAKASAKSKTTGTEYMTFPQASDALGINLATVRNLASRGTLKTFTFGRGMKRLVLRSSVRELLAKKAEVK